MDRISKALELARQGQKVGTAAVAEDAPQARRRPSARAIEDAHTRRLEVKAEVLQRNRVLTANSPGLALDSYRLLRTRVLRRMEKSGWAALGITSSARGEGKTLTAVNLAVSMAMERHLGALLIETDLRRPAVHRFFEIQPEVGIADYLGGDAELETLLVNPGIDRLALLACPESIRGSSEVLRSARMAELVEELKARRGSRIVIFNMPPVLVGDDVVAFSALLDAVLLVIEDGRTQTDELKKSLHLLEEVAVIGTVLNKSSEPEHGYGYTY